MSGIIDVWTQYISPTPPGVNPQGENVFRNYGMLDVFHNGTDPARMVEAMDRRGIGTVLMAGDNETVAKAQERFPGRIYGQYHADPTRIMKAVADLQHFVRRAASFSLPTGPSIGRKARTVRGPSPLNPKQPEPH